MNAKQKIHQVKLTEWAALIREQSESNLTVREWCRQNNYTIHSYNYWKHLLKEEAVKSALPDIVPLLQPSETDTAFPASIHGSNIPALASRNSRNTITAQPLLISAGDVRIEIGSSTSDDVITEIIKAVRHV